MHEMGLVSRAVSAVLEEVEGAGVARVTTVNLKIGELMDVVDELVPGLFDYLSRGTVLEGAQLVIEKVPAYVQCRSCHEAWHVDVLDRSTWVCPRCGVEKNYRMVSGREFLIDTIEVEMEEACAKSA